MKAVSSIKFLIAAILFNCTVLMASMSIAQENAPGEKGVTISYFQPLHGLEEYVLSLDTIGVIDRDTDWRPFYSADVWVFFIATADDLETLPEFAAYPLRRAEQPITKGLNIFEFSLPDGSLGRLIVLAMSDFEGVAEDKMICAFSKAIYEQALICSNSDLI